MTISNLEFESIIGPDPIASGTGGAYSQQYQDQILQYGIDPVKAANIYNVPAHDGTGVKIGIIALGGGWKPSDLTASLNRIGITDTPNIEVVSVDGAGNVFVNTGNLYSGNSSTVTLLSFETALDLYCVSAVVPKANIVVYRGVPHTSGYLAALDRAVDDQCDVIATSFSYDEPRVTDQMLASFESIFQRAVSQGTTIFASTGDWGSQVAISNPIVGVTYPASSPNVIGVGGSYFKFDANGNFVSEEAASQSNGGVSILFPAPPWQENLTYTTYPDNQTHPLTMRGVPDVVTPFGDYLLYFDSTLWIADGASASAPLMAGIAARYVGITGKRLGLLTRDYFYPDPTLFNSILTADNTTSTNVGNDASYISTGYSLTPGWNPLTGLGSIKGRALLDILDPPPFSSAIKYGLGVTYLLQSGSWQPLKRMWIRNIDNSWHTVKTGWVCRSDGNWERIYPTPRGIFTPNIASITSIPYQHYADQTRSVLVTNTGDFDLIINSIVAFDSVGNFTTVANNFPASPLMLTPNTSTTVSTQIFGNVAGNFSGNLSFTLFTGYLGYANVSYPIYANVLPDYAAISSNVSLVANLFYYQGDPATGGKITNAAQTISIVNSGNGANLVITNATSQNGYFAPYNLTANTLGFNFNTFTGNTANITVAPVGSLSAGTYSDALIVTSNANNFGSYKIPVTVDVGLASGHAIYETPGTYTLTVPPHVYSIQVLVVGSGGGGGLSISNYQVGQGGSGGGGGSGGYSLQTLSVTPGETLTVTIGVPGGTGSLNVNIFYVATNYSWSSFMNSYAVWFTPNSPTPVGRYVSSKRELIVPTTGNYTITGQAASNMIVSIDGTQVLTAVSSTTSNTAVISLLQGIHSINMLSINNGGVGGFALTVQDSGSNLVWSTRSLLNPTAGTSGGATTLTGSFGTVSVAGGAGGNGGYDDTPPPPSPWINWDIQGFDAVSADDC